MIDTDGPELEEQNAPSEGAPITDALQVIGFFGFLLFLLAAVWTGVRAGWEEYWYGQAVSWAETVDRLRASSPQARILILLSVPLVYLAGGTLLYLFIGTVLWAQRQWKD